MYVFNAWWRWKDKKCFWNQTTSLQNIQIDQIISSPIFKRIIVEMFLRHPGHGFDFSSPHQNLVCRSTKDVCDHWLPAMLETIEADTVDKVPPFIGGIVDPWCGNENFDVRWTITTYIDLGRYLYRKDELIRWIAVEPDRLRAWTRNLKAPEGKTFLRYQASAKGTQK